MSKVGKFLNLNKLKNLFWFEAVPDEYNLLNITRNFMPI